MKASMFDSGTENFRPEGGVIYGRNVRHYYRRRYHRLRGLGWHQSRSAQNALSRRGALHPVIFMQLFFHSPFIVIRSSTVRPSFSVHSYPLDVALEQFVPPRSSDTI